MWAPGATRQQQGSTLQMLRLQSAPTTLVGLLHGRSSPAWPGTGWPRRTPSDHRDEQAPPESTPVPEDSDPGIEPEPDVGPVALSVAADEAISAALVPRGRLVPRDVTESVAAADAPARDAEAAAANRMDQASWHLWRWSHSHAAGLLDGSIPPKGPANPTRRHRRGHGQSVLRPRSSVFRYAVQRALAIGGAVAAVVALRGNTNAFWIALTLLLVMQPDTAATGKKAVRAAAGTWAGVVLALLLATVLPAGILVPWVAALLLIGGFAWLKRNYASMTVGTASPSCCSPECPSTMFPNGRCCAESTLRSLASSRLWCPWSSCESVPSRRLTSRGPLGRCRNRLPACGRPPGPKRPPSSG